LVEMLKQNFKVLTGNEKPGAPYARKLNQCKLTFNCAMLDDVNMRFFEAISCGRMLLTDYLPAQDEFATEGKHYVSYKDGKDLIEKVRYYLMKYKERESIAKEGMEHIQKYHGYNNRLEQLRSIVPNHEQVGCKFKV
jgi:spore maturation protein CgeB